MEKHTYTHLKTSLFAAICLLLLILSPVQAIDKFKAQQMD